MIIMIITHARTPDSTAPTSSTRGYSWMKLFYLNVLRIFINNIINNNTNNNNNNHNNNDNFL